MPLAEMIDTMQSDAGILHPFLTSGAKIGIDLNDKFDKGIKSLSQRFVRQ